MYFSKKKLFNYQEICKNPELLEMNDFKNKNKKAIYVKKSLEKKFQNTIEIHVYFCKCYFIYF